MNSTYQPVSETEPQLSNQELKPKSSTLILTPAQKEAVRQIKEFALSDESCFILTGSAGTGKTTIIQSICDELRQLHIKTHLCAPTGRASRILRQKTGYDAVTIHSSIYTLDKLEVRQETSDANDPSLRYYFPLKADQPSQAVWIIDESSMVGDTEVKTDTLHFGSGRLLTDLLHYLRLDRQTHVQSGLKVLFVGDPIQLPPVGSNQSALDRELLHSKLGRAPRHLHLDQVLRQAKDSGILSAATRIRDAVEHNQLYRAKLEYNSDVQAIKQPEVFQKLLKGFNQELSCVALTYSNAEAYRIIQTFRELLFGDESTPLQQNERLIVMKNHHGYQLNNGDQLRVISPILQSRNTTISLKGSQPIQLQFIQVEAIDLSEPQRGSGQVWLLENTLWLRDREEPAQLTQALIIDFERRLKEYSIAKQLQIPKRGSRAFSRFLMSDLFFNALKVRFAYAMTCHKAQGGEWEEVILKPKSLKRIKSEIDAKWLYTGITRASRVLYIMNDEEKDSQVAQPTQITTKSKKPPPCNDPKALSKIKQNQANIVMNSVELSPSTQSQSQYIKVSHLASMSNGQRVLTKLIYAAEKLNLLVDHIESLQYCYRIVFKDKLNLIQIDFNYNGKAKVTKISNSIIETWGLSLPFINAFILVDSSHQAMPKHENLLSDINQDIDEYQYTQLRDQLDRDLHKKQLRWVLKELTRSSINIMSARSEPYALSLLLSGPNGEGRISFFHNGKEQWTSCRAIDTLPTSLEASQLFA